MGMNINLVKIFKVPTKIKCICGKTFDAKDQLEDEDIEKYMCDQEDELNSLVVCPKCKTCLNVVFKLNTTIKSIEVEED